MGKFDACSNLSLDPSCRNNRLFGPLPPVPFPYTLRGAGGLVARAFIVGRGVAQHGSAPRSGRGGPRFKSGRPDHFLLHTRRRFVLHVPMRRPPSWAAWPPPSRGIRGRRGGDGWGAG